MRNSFSGFYGISEDSTGNVFTSEDTIFIFDANILLTLYRCEEETRDQFVSIWRKIKDRCWFPHQVCLEYQRNRLKVIKKNRDSLSNISGKVNSTIADLKKELYGNDFNQTVSRYSRLHGELGAFFSEIEKVAQAFSTESIDSRKSRINFLAEHDVIRDVIDELTDGKIGPPPKAQQVIEDLNKAGKIRYKYKTGPGYEDTKDKITEFYSFNGINYDGEYGDYYVWSQMLDHVRDNKGKSVVYVTNDGKADFFYKIEGKVRGPNESLITEMKSCGASNFILQSIDTFLHHANTYLNAKIDESVITELSNASEVIKLRPAWDYTDHINTLYKTTKGLTSSFYNDITGKDEYEIISELQKDVARCESDIKFLQAEALNSLNDEQLAAISHNLRQLISEKRSLENLQRIYRNKIAHYALAESLSQSFSKGAPPEDEE